MIGEILLSESISQPLQAKRRYGLIFQVSNFKNDHILLLSMVVFLWANILEEAKKVKIEKPRWIHYGYRGKPKCLCGKSVPHPTGRSHRAYDTFGLTMDKDKVTCRRCKEVLKNEIK